jgi:hypothetical protein
MSKGASAMTITAHSADWTEQAACAGTDLALWFTKDNRPTAKQTCARCPVRAECLYEALQIEPGYQRYGVRGGLTGRQRRSLHIPTGPKPAALATLRALFDQLDQQDEPDDDPPDEGTSQPMSTTPTPAPTPDSITARAVPNAQEEAEAMPVGQLLGWAKEHPDTDVQKQATDVAGGLASLRARYATDRELAAVTTEAEQLEKRLAELRARKQELAPAKPKAKRKPVEYPAAEVRAWAAANGLDCPPVGRVPKAVVDAWRQATGSAV